MKKPFSSEGLYRAFIYTVLCLLALSVLIPVLWVLMASVKEDIMFYEGPFSLPRRLDLANFSEAWKEANMGTYFINSLKVTLLSLGILLAVSIPASYALSRFSFPFRSFFRSYFMAGLFVNASYIVVPIFLLITDIGRFFDTDALLNNHFVLALVYASCAVPFTVYLLTGYFVSLDKEYEEAAYMDGAGNFKTMLFIITPMARPAVTTVILFNFLTFWNEYIIGVTLMTDDSAKTLPLGLMNLMKAQNASAEYGRMYAGLVIVMLPALVLYILLQKRLTDGISLGGVKG